MAAKTETGKQEPAPSQSFDSMDGSAKIRFLGKLVIFVITFGFAFPTLFD